MHPTQCCTNATPVLVWDQTTDGTYAGAEEQQPLQHSSQEPQRQQQPYKGLGTNSVVSSDGEPLTRSADVGTAMAASTASEGAELYEQTGISGEGVTAGGVGGQGGSAGATSAAGAVTGSTGAGGAGAPGMVESAKAVSMDGDIIGKASEADALLVAAAESPPAGASPASTLPYLRL